MIKRLNSVEVQQIVFEQAVSSAKTSLISLIEEFADAGIFEVSTILSAELSDLEGFEQGLRNKTEHESNPYFQALRPLKKQFDKIDDFAYGLPEDVDFLKYAEQEKYNALLRFFKLEPKLSEKVFSEQLQRLKNNAGVDSVVGVERESEASFAFDILLLQVFQEDLGEKTFLDSCSVDSLLRIRRSILADFTRRGCV